MGETRRGAGRRREAEERAAPRPSDGILPLCIATGAYVPARKEPSLWSGRVRGLRMGPRGCAGRAHVLRCEVMVELRGASARSTRLSVLGCGRSVVLSRGSSTRVLRARQSSDQRSAQLLSRGRKDRPKGGSAVHCACASVDLLAPRSSCLLSTTTQAAGARLAHQSPQPLPLVH